MKKMSATKLELLLAKINPFKSAEDYLLEGTVEYYYNSPESCLKYFDMSIAINPKNPECYFMKEQAFLILGLTNEALENINIAIDLSPENPVYYFEKGLILDKRGEYSQAIEAYNTALKLNSHYIEAYKYRGIAKVILRQTEEGIKDLNIAINNGTDDNDTAGYTSYYYRGLANYWSNNYKSAEDDFSKSIELYNEAGLVFEHRGYIKIKTSDKKEGLSDLLKAATLYIKSKEDKKLKRIIAKLEELSGSL